MKNTDFEQLNEKVVKLLRPSQSIVSLKYISKEEDLKNYGEVRWYPGSGTVCQLLSFPAYFDGLFGMKRENFSLHCGGSNGLQTRTEDWYEGVCLGNQPNKWHGKMEDAKKHMDAMKIDLPEDTLFAMLTAPLKAGYIEDPDVISLALLPAAAFHLLAGLLDHDYEPIQFPFRGESTCADTWNHTYKTGKPGLSLGCRGDRSTGGLHGHEVRVTMTLKDLLKAVDGMERIEKDGIHYPYYPMGDMLSF